MKNNILNFLGILVLPFVMLAIAVVYIIGMPISYIIYKIKEGKSE
jgi:hypothetical protein